MIQYHEALEHLERVAATHLLSSELIHLDQCLGRVLAEDVLSSEQVPSFHNSSMDGFAVFAKDTIGASQSHRVKIKVNGMVAAGDLHAFKTFANQGAGVAVEIMTGAPVPEGGLNAIVRIEDVVVERDQNGNAISILVHEESESGEFIRPIGTDYQIGQKVFNRGTRIEPEHILAASSLGIHQLKVIRFPKVVIISTGSELVSPETKTLEPGMIRNSTGPFLKAKFKTIGIDAHYMGVIQDDPRVYRQALESALEMGADLILSTGAVSMGKFDFVTDVLNELNVIPHFHKVAIRPGKPILFAEFDKKSKNTIFFGIPGNPVSTAVGFRFFVEPFIRMCLGLKKEKPQFANLLKDVIKSDGLQCFFKSKTMVQDERVMVEALNGQASYIVSALVEANSWVVLPIDGGLIPAGTRVEVFPLHHSFELGVLS